MAVRNNPLQKPLYPSARLSELVGPGALSRAQAVQKVWAYIKARNLQDPDNRREIVADQPLHALVGSGRLTMFDLSRHVSRNLQEGAAPSPVFRVRLRLKAERLHGALC